MEARRVMIPILGKPVAALFLRNLYNPLIILQWPRRHTERQNDSKYHSTMTLRLSPFQIFILERGLWTTSNRQSSRLKRYHEKTGPVVMAQHHSTASIVPHTNLCISRVPKGRWQNPRTGQNCRAIREGGPRPGDPTTFSCALQSQLRTTLNIFTNDCPASQVRPRSAHGHVNG